MITQVKSIEETHQLASKLANKLSNGGVLTLSGPLGAGKTTFTQAFAKALGIKAHLTSPTFILVKQYSIPDYPDGHLYHLDLYRLEQPIKLDHLGLHEILSNPKNLVLIEWGEKLGDNLPKNTTKIVITPLSGDERQIEITE